MNTRSPILSTLIFCLALLACREAESGLRPPTGFQYAAPSSVASKGESYDCPDMPEPFTGELDFTSPYEGSDEARDDLNEEAKARYEKQTESIKDMERGFTELVEDYLESGEREALACAIDSLADWAQAGALKGDVGSHQGKSVRKWALGSLASAYLRLKFSASQPLEPYQAQSERIESWFYELAQLVIDDWSGQPMEKINNHEYWSAWSVMAVAVVVNDRALFDWSVDMYRTAATQVDLEGYLPNELGRDSRALFYHNYALPPLAMIAAFAKVNGVDLLSEGEYALQRLAENVLQGVDDPDRFEDKTGSEQETEDLEDSKFTWLEPYCWMLPCSSDVRDRLADMRPLSNYRVGGDVTMLFRSLEPMSARLPAFPEPAGRGWSLAASVSPTH